MKSKRVGIISIVFVIVASVTAWYVSYRAGLVTTYNDAMSHLNIARFVIDGKQPGLAQLGSVWLPLNHILELALIWNNWAWHSGFAGSFISMLAYIFSAIGIYAIVKELTGNVWASLVAGSVFVLNPNMLYLQTTPLTEPLYLVLVIASFFFLIKFMKTDDLKYLLISGVFGFLQVLARYDGWFVVFIEGLVIIYHLWFTKKASFQEIMAKFVLFAMPIIFAAGLWLLWNALIFGSPLYFILGPYSAHAQQVNIQSHSGLITKGNWKISLLAYWYAAVANVGLYAIIASVIGVILFFVLKKKDLSFTTKSLVFILLISPVLFNIIALWLGFSILNLPQLHWNPSPSPAGQWFNVRYGIMALPFVAVFVGMFADLVKKKVFIALIAILVVAQSFLIYQQGIITITDGTIGSSAFVDNDVAQVLQNNVQPGQNILISLSFFNAVIFKSNLPLDDFVYEGVNDEWTEALAQPQKYATWIVMANGNVGDPIYTDLRITQSDAFLKNYKLFYAGANANIYELRDTDELFVYTNGTKLTLGGTDQPYSVNGVNSYDLAYKSPEVINDTLKNLSDIGVNTVRFWMFGDGNTDGFQPTAGIMNESRFENADYLIADAKKYNIRLIPVLVNNWTDYGGEQQYLKWVGQDPSNQDAFYTNPQAISLFENYINHVITRKNTVTGVTYNDDPTIMAWEVVNEPRWSANDNSAFVQWFSTISNYIRQKDSNHMITMETDTTSLNQNGTFTINDNCAILPVDLCAAHLYLYDGNGNLTYNSLNEVDENLTQYIAKAQADGKPFIMGEVGISKTTSPFDDSPLEVLKNIVTTSNTGSGILIWNWSDQPDASYGFSPKGTNGVYTLSDLSRVLGGTQPSTLYLSPETAIGGGYDISIPGMEPTSTSTASTTTGSTLSNLGAPTTTIAQTPPPTEISSGTPPPVTPPATPPAQTETTPSSPQPLALPYTTSEFDAADWNGGWGGLTEASGTLIVGSDSQNTSGGIFLSNSEDWQNYIAKATINWVKGQVVTLIARRSNSEDYLECVFSYNADDSEHIDINRIFNNQTVSMGDEGTISNEADNVTKDNMIIAMQVTGDRVECGINNAYIQNNMGIGLQPALFTGGIGFTTWDPQEGNSEIIVKNVSVTPLF